MAFYTTTRKAALETRLAKKKSQLEKLYEAYDDASDNVKEYRFDSGEGSQRAEYRDLKDISAEITRLEKEIDALIRKLSGVGIVNMNLRRKQYRGGF